MSYYIKLIKRRHSTGSIKRNPLPWQTYKRREESSKSDILFYSHMNNVWKLIMYWTFNVSKPHTEERAAASTGVNNSGEIGI